MSSSRPSSSSTRGQRIESSREPEHYEDDFEEEATQDCSSGTEDTQDDLDDDDDDDDEDETEESDDDDEDSDDDSDDSDDSDEFPLDVKVHVIPPDETRGFTLRRRRRGLHVILRRLKRDYEVAALRLFYTDADGDVVTIKRSSDFEYAWKTHEQSSTSLGGLKLKLRAELVAESGAVAGAVAGAGAGAGARAGSASQPQVPPMTLAPPDGESRDILWVPGEVLGAGSFGTVYSGLDLRSGERIACKECLLASSGGASLAAPRGNGKNHLKVIQREVRILSQLKHPNIIRYLGTEVLPHSIRIFLEVAEGSLKNALREFGPLPEPLIRKYTLDIVRGLEFLHSRRVIHRDIKPSNLLLANGLIKIADFGCSALLADVALGPDAAGQSDTHHTIAGTTMYMAPEVMHHGHGGEGEGVDLNCAPPSPSKTRRGSQGGYGRKTDVWSLGITIVELAKAESPFRTAAAALYSVCVKKEYPSLPSGLSTEAHAFLARCLVENPSTRASTIELLQDPFVLDSLSEERVRANSARPGSRQTTSTVSFSPIISQTKGAARSASQSLLGEFGASSRFSGWGPDSDEGGSLEVSNSSHEERSLWKTILGDTCSRAGPDALSEEKSVPSSFRSSLFQDKGDSSPDRNVK